MSSNTTQCQILFRPEDPALGYLPEGPYPLGADRFSWVSIQHAADSVTGSLNLFDATTGQNKNFALPGRPGFAFPTSNSEQFVVGLERSVGLFHTADAVWTELVAGVDGHSSGTIINDGVLCKAGVIFGCKDLKFAEKKAGLYLFRAADQQLISLRTDQICSNGKVILDDDGQSVRWLDIDTPTQQVVRYELEIATGALSEPTVVLDLTGESVFPDGMIGTPDGSGVIIAMFNPNDSDTGEARQYDLASGDCVARWTVAGSPQVTCPQLIEVNGKVRLVLTTAAENMSPEKLAAHPNAGCLFAGDTDFSVANNAPVFKTEA